jgi:hypothetical protein
VYLAESEHAPFGKLEPLAILETNPDGAGIVQADLQRSLHFYTEVLDFQPSGPDMKTAR